MWNRQVLLLSAVFTGFSCRATEKPEFLAKEVLKVADREAVAPATGVTGQRIIGGAYTTIEKYPYTVQVLYNNRLTCGGSLLTSRTVLSAAHCFVDSNGSVLSNRLFSIRAGSSTLNSGGQTRSVSRLIPHESYNTPLLDNDIAVLVLASRVTLSSSVAMAAIAGPAFQVPDNVSVVHVGWGWTNIHVPVPSTVLREVSVYVVNQTTCANSYAYLASLLLEPFPVTANMICAGVLGEGGRDACQGDSGGPLIYNGVVIGVTSWGYSCAEPWFPGVSARVSNFAQWINRTVSEETTDGWSIINNKGEANCAGIVSASTLLSLNLTLRLR